MTLPHCYRCSSQPCRCSDRITLYCGDALEVMAGMEAKSVEAVVTDPPYGLTANKKGGSGKASLNLNSPAGRSRVTTGGFMGCKWDSGIPDVDVWLACLRVLKPGGHLLAFGGTRTFHRLTCAIEDAGFEIRDCIMWVYGSGFPKSLDVGKAIDKALEAERKTTEPVVYAGGHVQNHGGGKQGYHDWKGEGVHCGTAPATEAAQQWDGWGTALKPAWEPIIVARRALEGTVAANVLEHGVGGLNIDGCRVGCMTQAEVNRSGMGTKGSIGPIGLRPQSGQGKQPQGRWPANLVHDGSEEVVELFPETTSGKLKAGTRRAAQDEPGSVCYGIYGGKATNCDTPGDSGSAARFFYCAKASKADRTPGNDHPTVKPVDLMRWLVRLVCPIGGTVLDPFNGSGTTTYAAREEHCRAIGIEREEKYCEIGADRLVQGMLF